MPVTADRAFPFKGGGFRGWLRLASVGAEAPSAARQAKRVKYPQCNDLGGVIMEVQFYNLYCDKCEDSGFRLLPSEDVQVTLDLRDGSYLFKAICPVCGDEIYNTRRGNSV